MMSDKLSGVVTNAVGKRLSCLAFALALLSPVRESKFQGNPKASMGARSAFSVSSANARSGVTHNTRADGGRFEFHFDESGFSFSHFKIGPIQTASVFPVPVAEWTSPLSPSKYARQADRWNRNGFQPIR